MADIYKKISEYNELAELDASGKMLVAQSDETYSVGADTMAEFVKGRITMDATPTQGSSNPVTSNGVYNGIRNYKISDRSTEQGMFFNDWIMLQHPGGAEYKVQAKDALGMAGFGDSVPTQNSTKVVWSGGVYDAIEEVRALTETDDTLSVEDKPADAKAAGDRITSLESGRFTLSVSDAHTIPNGTDYDSLKTLGNYRVLTAAAAQSMLNCPTTGAHRLFVATIINNRFVQIVYGNTLSCPEYRRFWDGTRWGDWRRIANTTDIPAVDASLSITGAAADAKATGNLLNNAVYSPPIGLHTTPKNQGVLNCIKRARQMTDIKWSPAVTIDRVNIVSGQSYEDAKNYFQNQFIAGKEYTGLPYSSHNFIGTRKSLEAFATSAVNPNSLECTDSQYTGNENVASYFGTVCVTLTSYALHAPQINSPNYENLVGLTKLYDLYSGGAYHDIEDLALCDVLWEHGHVALVTDIIRDSNGHITHIEVSESTKFGSSVKSNSNDNYGGKCRRKVWTKAEFLKWFASFGVYRYADEFLAAIPYYPCPYVPMADEPPYVEQPTLPCIPLEGDKAYYFLSDSSQRSVKVLIYESGYSYLRVKQNGENFALLDVAGLSEVTVACQSGTEAIYEAYLCNMSNNAETTTSKSCSWIQIGSSSEKTMHDNGDGTITFSYQRDLDVGDPFVVVYNGTNVTEGLYSPILDYTKVKESDKWKYTFTVSPPSGVTVETISLLIDLRDYGWCPTSAFRPTVV